MTDSSLLRRLRTLAVLAVTTGVLAGCGAGRRSHALGFREGTAPGSGGLGTLEAIGLFVLIPATVLLTIAALVWLPGMVRGARYRPAKGWSASPLWFGGPPDPAAAVESASAGELVRGGASGSW
ncbi:MAG: hypothetical protein H7323_14745 [Frankiales bacterium]|nr:hypothetical protein [Frankiales bacterium]